MDGCGDACLTNHSYEYDARNRLIQTGKHRYRYNAQGHRIEQAVRGKRTRYVIDESQELTRVLMEIDNSGQIKARYVYGLGLIGREDADGRYHCYHSDMRGSTTLLSDESGKVTDRYTYGIYGELEKHEGTTHQPFCYNGRDGVMTDANGLYYMRARYYDPKLKRFINRDVIRGDVLDGQTFNRYAYVNGDPVSFIDPLGLMKCPDKNNKDTDWKDTDEKGKTGTVWDSIKATQPAYEGTSIPKSFNIKLGEQEFWVNPNGTKHMLEYVTSGGKNIGTLTASVSSQAMLTEFQSAFKEEIKNNGGVTDKMIRGGDWEFMLSAPRGSGLNVVVKHARYNPQ